MARDEGRSLATSSLAVGRFAAKKGSLRSPRGRRRLVASLRTFQHHSFLVMLKTIVSFDLACFSAYPKDICLITFLTRTRTGYNYSLILLACKEVIFCTLAASFFIFCFSDLHFEKSSANRYLINVIKRMKCSYANARYFKDMSDVLQIRCLPV